MNSITKHPGGIYEKRGGFTQKSSNLPQNLKKYKMSVKACLPIKNFKWDFWNFEPNISCEIFEVSSEMIEISSKMFVISSKIFDISREIFEILSEMFEISSKAKCMRFRANFWRFRAKLSRFRGKCSRFYVCDFEQNVWISSKLFKISS